MDLHYSAEELAFRDEVRSWLEANLPVDLKEKVGSFAEVGKADTQRWHKILSDRGWIAPHWPVEWGGTGWNVVQRYIFEEECGYAGAPQLPALSLMMCAPVLIRYGTQAQKERFLPRIHDGSESWCQGYSEPGAGSDLSALKTRAVRDGDNYIVTGQKIWTTHAQWADWMFCLVRTDPDAVKQQEGISFLLIDMKTPGITIRPLILMDGSHEVNEVFFDAVRVPVANLVHEEGRGWTVAKYLLGYERLNQGRIGIAKRTLARLKQYAAGQSKGGRVLLDDPRFRDRVARVEVELLALEITNLRMLDQMRRSGRPPGAEVSILKIKGTEIHQALSELFVQAAGPQAQPMVRPDAEAEFDRFAAALMPRFLNLRKMTIYGGSNEIQRNIVSKQLLGL
jgi:alkylation response protein AidB-like acyl-CoA dehydrogenase